MTCLYPLHAWKAKKLNANGKRPVVFNRWQGNGEALEVPCGKCLGCLQDRAKDWSVRIQNEASLHERNAFITLTYSDQHLPEDGKLDKSHLQKFFRSLRDKGNKLRYFACGEYGGITHRPHYHSIVFGMDFRSGRSEPCGNNGEFVSPELSSFWDKGNCVIAPVTPASCAYVAGYCNKKIGDPDTFTIMSRNPGIGHAWIDKHHEDVVRAGAIVGENGQHMRVPARYMNWKEDDLERVKRQRQKYIRDMAPERKWDLHRERQAKEVHLKQLQDARKLKEKIGR